MHFCRMLSLIVMLFFGFVKTVVSNDKIYRMEYSGHEYLGKVVKTGIREIFLTCEGVELTKKQVQQTSLGCPGSHDIFSRVYKLNELDRNTGNAAVIIGEKSGTGEWGVSREGDVVVFGTQEHINIQNVADVPRGPDLSARTFYAVPDTNSPSFRVFEIVSQDSGEYGTAAEAKAMLEKVVADMKASKVKTLQDIAAGTYNKKDLYPFCGGADGKFTTHGANKALVGQSLKDLKSKSGEPIGEEIYKEAQAGKVSEVSYAWPRPNESDPVPKLAYVEKVGDEVCAVGYYK